MSAAVGPADEKKSYVSHIRKDELAYTAGVINVAFSAWLAGAKPWAFWCFHGIKMIFLLSYKLYINWKVKRQYFLLDYCYTINYLSILYYAFCIMKKNIPSFHDANSLNWLGPITFRCLFTVCAGPLALSIVTFRNSLVFHSWNQLAVLAVHWSPNIALWGMRWWGPEMNAEFPDVFHIGCDDLPNQKTEWPFSADSCEGTFVQLWLWPFCTYGVWCIAYGLFFFYFGAGMLERGGYHTMYEDMKDKPPLKAILANWPEKYRPIKYLMCHATACGLSMLVAPILWHSFALHTIYLLVIFNIAILNGSTFYFRVFAKRYYKEKMDECAQEIHARQAALEAEEGGARVYAEGEHDVGMELSARQPLTGFVAPLETDVEPTDVIGDGGGIITKTPAGADIS